MAANQANNEDVYAESVLEVWEKLKLPFSKLLDDVVCTVPDSTVKDSAFLDNTKVKMLRNAGTFQDHNQCHQRITQLEGLVASKNAAIKNEQEKIHAYTGTIKLLRDELHNKGAVSVNRQHKKQGCLANESEGRPASSTVLPQDTGKHAGTIRDSRCGRSSHGIATTNTASTSLSTTVDSFQ
ncbi:hypothetical protein AAVH_41236, partial [Aphelenchoides avenae]